MVAVDEFELGDRRTPEATPPPMRARRRGDRPGTWVGLAVAAVAIGALAAPVTLPRATAEMPGWAGLVSVVYATADDDVDAVTFAREVAPAGVVTVTTDHLGSDREAMGGTVVVLLRDVPEAADLPSSGGVIALMDTAEGTLVAMTFDDRMLTVLEAAAPRSDWVCEPEGGQALCTALADPEITVVLDWPTP